MTNIILQSLGLDLVNINVSAKFYQNMPNGSRVMGIFGKLTGTTQLHKLSRDLGIASTDDKCHFAIPCAISSQYQCVCKTLSKYSKRFKSYGHFSQSKPTGDKQLHKRAIIGTTPKVNLQLLCWSTFSGSCNMQYHSICQCI